MTEVPAAVRLLLINSAAGVLCDRRVYVGELPPEDNASMPRRCIVIRATGGIVRAATDSRALPRLDIWSQGETYMDAGVVDRAVYDALKGAVREVYGSVLIHSVAVGSGAYMVRDPETGWPSQWRSVIVHADEREVA